MSTLAANLLEFPKAKVPPRKLRAKRTYLNKEELLRVMQAAKEDSSRSHLLCLLAFRHGLRVSELVNIRLSDDPAKKDSFLDVEQKAVVIRRLKNSETTTHSLMPSDNSLFDEVFTLRTYLAERNPKAGDFLFGSRQGAGLDASSFSKIFLRICEAAKIDRSKAFCHVLKHTRASLMIKNGAEIAHVKTFLGHKALSSTMVYSQLNDADSVEMAKMVDDKLFG
jgi:site-specific recombinase XerD